MDDPARRTPTIAPLPSDAMQATTVPLRFNQIRVTNPSSQANGILSARIDTRIKLRISFHSGSSIQFLKLPKTPSVHNDYDAPEQPLKFSLELRGSAGGAIIQYICSKCNRRKDQATRDIVDFRAKSTIVAIENGTVNVEFFIKCYASHHGKDHHGFHIDAILQDHRDEVIDRARLSLLFNILGKVPAHNLSAAGIIPSVNLPDDTVQEDNNQPLPWVDSTTEVSSDAGLFPCFTLPTRTVLSMGDLQQPVQFPQSGVSSGYIGPSVDRHISLDMACDRTHASALLCNDHTLPFLPLEAVTVPGSIPGQPQCVGGLSQASGVPPPTSQISNENLPGTSGAPDALSALLSGQGRGVPNLLEPEGTYGGDSNQAPNEIFLEEILPEKGPMTGGIPIAIFGENFPSTPIYVVFGDNWVRARRRDARTLRCRLPPSAKAGVVGVTLSQTPSRNAPEVGWSNATFEYEDTRVEAQLSMLKSIYHEADETTVQKTFASVQQSLATINTHPNLTLNTRVDHPDNREGAETSSRPKEVNLEEVSIHFLRTYSIHPNWKQIISSCNDYGQTMAHISVTLNYFRLLQHLLTWKIDLNIVDDTGLTALHYAYLFRQEECARLLIRSGADPFILDDLGRSPSNLNPSLEVKPHPSMEICGYSNTLSTSPADFNIEMPEEAEALFAKQFLIHQWTQKIEDERRSEAREVPHTRYQRRADVASTASTDHSADERVGRVIHRQSSSSPIQFTQDIPPLVASQELVTLADTAAPSRVLSPPTWTFDQTKMDGAEPTELHSYVAPNTIPQRDEKAGSPRTAFRNPTPPSRQSPSPKTHPPVLPSGNLSATQILNDHKQRGNRVKYEGYTCSGHTDTTPQHGCVVYVNGEIRGVANNLPRKKDAREVAAKEAVNALLLPE